MKDQIIETIRQTLALKPDQISESTPLKDIAKDSMDVVELIAVLSATYKIRVEPAQLQQVQTVGDIVAYVLRYKHSVQATDPLQTF